MALSRRKALQQPLFAGTQELNARSHPFYESLNKVLDPHHFDAFSKNLCARFYDDGAEGGRPGLAPGIYFRCLLVGYFKGIDSERAASTGGATTAFRSRRFWASRAEFKGVGSL